MTASTLAGYHLSSNHGQGSGASSASSSSNTLTFITPPLPLGHSQPSIVQSNGNFGGMQQYGSNYPPTGPDGRHDTSGGYIYPSNGNSGSSAGGPGSSFMNSSSQQQHHQQGGHPGGPDRDGRLSDPNAHVGGMNSPRSFQYPPPNDVHRSPYSSFNGPGGDNGSVRGSGGYPGQPPPGMPWSPPMTGHGGFGQQPNLPPPPPGGMSSMADHGQYGPPPPGTGSSSSYVPSRYPDQSGTATAGSSSSHGGGGNNGGGRPGPYPSSKQGGPGSAGGEEDTDNRTRNAKAQKRHREKRKAHVKSVSAFSGSGHSLELIVSLTQLEETVAQLQQQMRAIRSGTHPEFVPIGSQYAENNGSTQPLMAQNDYLREENDRLRGEVDSLRRRLQDVEQQAMSGADPLSPSLRYVGNHGPTQNTAFSHPQFQDDAKSLGGGDGRASLRQGGHLTSGRPPPPRASSSSEGPGSSSAYGQAPGSGMSHSTSSEYYSSGGDVGGGGFMAYQTQMYQPPPAQS